MNTIMTDEKRKYFHYSNLQLQLLNTIDSLIFAEVVTEGECKDFKEFINRRLEETRIKLVEEETKR